MALVYKASLTASYKSAMCVLRSQYSYI